MGAHPHPRQCLLAANDPFLRDSFGSDQKEPPKEEGEEAAASDSGSPPGSSAVVPALLRHPARDEVQGAVLHILNEEGAGRDRQSEREG